MQENADSEIELLFNESPVLEQAVLDGANLPKLVKDLKSLLNLSLEMKHHHLKL